MAAQIFQDSINSHEIKVFIQIIHSFFIQQAKATGNPLPFLLCRGKDSLNPIHNPFITGIFVHTVSCCKNILFIPLNFDYTLNIKGICV